MPDLVYYGIVKEKSRGNGAYYSHFTTRELKNIPGNAVEVHAVDIAELDFSFQELQFQASENAKSFWELSKRLVIKWKNSDKLLSSQKNPFVLPPVVDFRNLIKKEEKPSFLPKDAWSLKTGLFAMHRGVGNKHHRALILNIHGDFVEALIMTSKSRWNKNSRLITRAELKLAKTKPPFNLYWAPVIHSRAEFFDPYEINNSFVGEKSVELLQEFTSKFLDVRL